MERPALAVLFTNPNSQDDLFLLDFMAERTVENANANGTTMRSPR
jgi:hypothetical protein